MLLSFFQVFTLHHHDGLALPSPCKTTLHENMSTCRKASKTIIAFYLYLM